jgi:poly-gamma-glutamate capsule biosynthesis protein CapA/YwtB (metallophosphatase superfamily)
MNIRFIVFLLAIASLSPAQVTMHFLGDCTIGCDVRWPGFDEYVENNDPSYFFSGVKQLLEADDYTIANLETTVIDSGTPLKKQFRFRAKPHYLEILKQGSVEVVTLANNHSWDYGDSGYAQTRRNLERYGIEYFAYDVVVRKEIKGIRFAFIGQSFHIQDSTVPRIKALRDSVDFIVVVFHWGNEKEYKPNATQISMAKTLINAGVDLIVGHHPHVIQHVIKYKDVPVAYSLGNFVFGGNRNPRDKRALILEAIFEKDKPVVVKEIPIKISSVDTLNDFRPIILEDKK